MTDRTGLVVAGAGARGAYEAGALSVLLPRLHDAWSAPSVFVGTSAGAVNVAALAGLAHRRPAEATGELVRRWESVDLSGVLDLAQSLVGAVSGYGSQVVPLAGPALAPLRAVLGLPDRLTSLLDTGPLEATLEPLVDWDALHANVEARVVDAVAVVATSVSTGGTVVFVEHGPGVELPEPDPRRDIVYVPTRLTVRHLLASAAVPGLFEPVWCDDPPGWYVDGGLRMNTPLKPALKLGATRLGVVATTPATPAPDAPGTPDRMPDVFAVAAMGLRVVLGSGVTEDLRTLLAVNEWLRARPGGDPRVEVPAWFAGPPAHRSDDLAHLAAEVLGRVRPRLRDPAVYLLDRFVGGTAVDHGELISFLLFDREFAAAAAELGAEHARTADRHLV
jgi:NTE family protein